MQHLLRRIVLTCALLLTTAPVARADTLAIVGGNVFDGETFVQRDLFARDGLFVAERPATLDRTIDAAGLYLLPPLAEGHTHNFFGGALSKGSNQAYLKAGVFYALCANNPNAVSKEWRDWSAADLGGKVDVIFANGGVTSPGGHPVELYRMIHTRMQGQPADTFMEVSDDSVFYQVEDAAALEQKFTKLLATEPDLVKLYLLGHNQGGQPFSFGGQDVVYTGLSEEVFRDAVKRSHAAGKRCIVHIETAADFALAVDAGADAVAHMPYALMHDPESKAISPEMAQRAAQRGMTVIATSGLGLTMLVSQKDPELQKRMRQTWEGNLRAMKEAGVKILVGSDMFTPINEANALEKSSVVSRAQILKMWTHDTPVWMFPERKIGSLEAGCEASVIGLTGDPLENWTAIQQVKLAVKQGELVGGATPKANAELLE